VMKGVMREGEHFGRIPGCGDKPALLKAGAEKIGLTFRLIPTLKIDRSELGNGHREYAVTCTLTTPAGEIVGEGVGCCSTMESKYRWRSVDAFEVTDLKIPDDAKERKAEYRKQGYGMRKVDGGWAWVRFTGSGDRQENPDIADQYNTVLKMAKKRAFVDAILTATAASDIFTQDIEEVAEPEAEVPAKPAANPAAHVTIQELHRGWLARNGWRRVLSWYESNDGPKFGMPESFAEPKTDADLAAIRSWLTAEHAGFLMDAMEVTKRRNAAIADAKRSDGPRLHPGDENGDPEPELAGGASGA
jgi:hypothetical protein